MAQIFDRSSNALARMSLVLSGLIIIALGVTLDQLQRSPWVTRQGQRPDQPVPFSHKHHVQGLGLQCQYCHTTVEKSSYAGIPPTKTCMNCHAQIWTNAQLLEPVRHSWATNQSLTWTKVHDLPDFALLQSLDSREQGHWLRELPRARGPDAADVYAEHAADGVVPGLPPQSGEESAADEPDLQHGMGSAQRGSAGVVRGEGRARRPTAQQVDCVTKDPAGAGPQMAALQAAEDGRGEAPAAMCAAAAVAVPASYRSSRARISWGISCCSITRSALRKS